MSQESVARPESTIEGSFRDEEALKHRPRPPRATHIVESDLWSAKGASQVRRQPRTTTVSTKDTKIWDDEDGQSTP
jgi:hypothetical protein